MRLFGRPQQVETSDEVPVTLPIPAFWSWWTGTGARRVVEAIGSGRWGDLAHEIGARVHAIDAELEWEVGPGDRARHQLCVTSAGNAALRPLAARWRRAAPAEDATWQYEPARRRDADVLDARVTLDDTELAVGRTTVAALLDEERLRLDVTVWHPAFAGMVERARQRFAFLALDWALGEDDVERWIGTLETPGTPAEGSRSLAEFVAAVDELASRPVQTSWVLLEGRREDGSRVVATARRPLRWIDAPLLDQHAAVTLAYAPAVREDGLPTPAGLDRLRAQEEALTAYAGPGAALLAHETTGGHRLLHLYSDSEDQNVTARIEAWVAGTAGASVVVTPDPAWRAVRHLA